MEIIYVTSLFLILSQMGGLRAQQCPGSKITREERETLIKGHNDRRRKLANGDVLAKGNVRLPKAKNMAEMVWDCSLEDTAQRYSEVCVWEHSDKKFRNFSGENLYESHSSQPIPRGNGDNSEGQAEAAMQGWWDEVKDMTAGTLFKDSKEGGNMIGHFTQMAWGDSAKIGCGYTTCLPFPTHEPWTKYVVYITCHYAPGGNVLNQHVYNAGKPCTDCWNFPSSRCEDGLCSGGNKVCRDKYENCNTLCSSEHRNDCPISCKTCEGWPGESSTGDGRGSGNTGGNTGAEGSTGGITGGGRGSGSTGSGRGSGSTGGGRDSGCTGGGRGSGSISPSVPKACTDKMKNCSKYSALCDNSHLIRNMCLKSCNAC